MTTQDELCRAALDETAVTDPQTKEVLRYRAALRQLSYSNNPNINFSISSTSRLNNPRTASKTRS